MKIADYIHLYLNCDTNWGKLVGIDNTTYTVVKNGEMIKLDHSQSLKPILRKLGSMTNDESAELNKRGISIGQRKGYSYTPLAILYLLSKHFDLFNLIEEGLAIESTKTISSS